MREISLRTATSVITKETYRGGLPWKASFVTVGLSVAGAILLATRIYFVSELLVLLAVLAVLFAVGTCVLLLLILLQEGMRWSVRQISEAKRRTLLSRGGPSFQSSNVDR